MSREGSQYESMQDACHIMNSVKWPCFPWVLISQWIEHLPFLFGRSWVQFVLFFLCAMLVSCWLIHLLHFITELKIHHLYSLIKEKNIYYPWSLLWSSTTMCTWNDIGSNYRNQKQEMPLCALANILPFVSVSKLILSFCKIFCTLWPHSLTCYPV